MESFMTYERTEWRMAPSVTHAVFAEEKGETVTAYPFDCQPVSLFL